jgi:hypothetical protein
MPSKRTTGLVSASVLILGAVVGLLFPAGPASARYAVEPNMIHAGSSYGWYPTLWREEFRGPLKSVWHKSGRGVVTTTNGMLTLKTGRSGSVAATLDTAGHATGRWEVGWKTTQYGSAHAAYTARTELVPAGGRPQYCGARNIALESYVEGHQRAQFYIHNLPNVAFVAGKGGTPIGGDHWHTFAVEVTPRHISTESRPEAFSGVPLTLRFSLRAVPGQVMTPARMQVDWARYWTLAKPDRKSISAPAPRMTQFAAACPPAA